MSAQKFNEERLMQVLLAPQISEKATFIADKNEQVVFVVTSDATKPEIKAAVELLFKVQVKSVQVSTRPSALRGARWRSQMRWFAPFVGSVSKNIRPLMRS